MQSDLTSGAGGLLASIPSDWGRARLDEVCHVIDCPHTTPSLSEKGPYLVRSQDMRTGVVRLDSTAHVTEETYVERTKRSAPEYGDILYSREGTYFGIAAEVPRGARVCLGQRMVQLRPKVRQLSHRFLKYWLNSPQMSSFIAGLRDGSVAERLNMSTIRGLPVPLPPIATQTRIANLLGTIDDRIDLLRQTNATLESMAQALFKSWFIDFHPVHIKADGRKPEGIDPATAALFPAEFEESALGLIPKGWGVEPIGDLVQAVGGSTPDTKDATFWEPAVHHWTSPKDLSGATAPVLLDTERKVSPAGLAKISSGLLPPGSLLMSSRAPIGYLTLTQVPVAINQGYIAIPPGGRLPPKYLYFWCKANMDGIKGRANGSTFMEISKKAFRPIPALLPPRPVIESFVEVAGSLFDRLGANERQARALIELRDALLPRLISGKLGVPEALTEVEEAAA